MKNKTYTITFDKAKSEILQMALNMYAEKLLTGKLTFDSSKERLENTQNFKDFLIEASDKTHEAGYCTDKDCKYITPKK